MRGSAIDRFCSGFPLLINDHPHTPDFSPTFPARISPEGTADICALTFEFPAFSSGGTTEFGWIPGKSPFFHIHIKLAEFREGLAELSCYKWVIYRLLRGMGVGLENIVVSIAAPGRFNKVFFLMLSGCCLRFLMGFIVGFPLVIGVVA